MWPWERKLFESEFFFDYMVYHQLPLSCIYTAAVLLFFFFFFKSRILYIAQQLKVLQLLVVGKEFALFS